MHVIVHVPVSLRQFSGGERELQLQLEPPATVEAIFLNLRAQHPGVVERALDERGAVRQHVNVFVDGESIRAGPKLGLHTPVRADSEVWILPSVSGG